MPGHGPSVESITPAGRLSRAATIALLAMAATLMRAPDVAAQPRQKVVVEPEYLAGGMHRAVFGEGYRGLWTTPVDLPVLDLATTGGGLTPVRTVGQAQSLGLAMTGADGRAYTFRSLHKHPERMLPEAWLGRMPAMIARDQTSHTHPAAAVILPRLAAAAGVAHTRPRLVVMPDDPALGEFREAFANEIGTIEEFPLPVSDTNPGFAGATAIISTSDLWDRWLEDPAHHIDDRAFLRARILDLWVDNFDRHRGQWRWMQVPGATPFQPLPEDPDMVFVHHDGWLMYYLRGRMPRFLKFDEDYPSKLDGPTINNFEIDRWLLSTLDADAWREVATDLQGRFTDAVIEEAVRAQPPEWFAINGPAMITALESRRDRLVDYVMAIYRYYADRVDVHATDRDEMVTIARGRDDAVEVTITAAGEAAPWFRRRFVPGETRDVRLYLQGGDDRVTRTGPAGGPIRVRVVAGGGHDVVDDAASGGTEVWRDAGTLDVRHGRGTDVREAIWTNPNPIEDAPWVERRSFGHWSVPGFTLMGNSDIGALVGYGVTRTGWDFRAEPASSVQWFSAAVSTGRFPGKVEYVGTFRRPASRLAWRLHAYGSSIERHTFFGLGNDTPRERTVSRYRSYENAGYVSASLEYQQANRLRLFAGPEVRYSQNGGDGDTILKERQPIGLGHVGSLALQAGVAFDSREPAHTPVVVDVFAGPQEVVEARTSGVRFALSGFVVPKGWDIDRRYGGTDALVAAYAGNERAHVAVRVGGRKLWGDYAWFDAATIGGSNNRGFISHRFTGDSSLYASLSLRTWFGSVDTPIIPIRFGGLVFSDVGRVWLEGESSDTWHASQGAGVLAQPLGLPVTFHALAGRSREGWRLAVGMGYPF